MRPPPFPTIYSMPRYFALLPVILRRAGELIAHQQALAKDLVDMAEAADQAEKIRRFLERVRATFPEDQLPDGFMLWFQWAAGHVNTLDPLSRPERIAKQMEPDRPRG